MRLRPRQKTFVERSVAALASRGNTLGVAPTGAGKTIMLSAVTGEMIGAMSKNSGAKACVLAHRDELTTQNRAKFQRVVPGISTSVIDATEKSWGGQVAFAMVPTLARASNLADMPRLDLLVAPTDQPIGTGNGAVTTFALLKRYTSGAQSWSRAITKPVAGAVRIALNGVEQMTGWSVNTTTGSVTFTTAPGAGVAITAGFEFDVPVRFDTDLLDVTLDLERLGSITSITVSAASASIGTATTTATYGMGTGATSTGVTKTVNLGTGGASGSTTVVNIGSTTAGAAGTTVVNTPTVTFANAVTQVGMPQANLTAQLLGLGGATADSYNRMSVNTPALLFNNAGAGIEATVNKAVAGNDAAFAFKTGFSARALIGLLGNDDFGFKVSPDGSAFFDAIRIDRASGQVELPQPTILPGLSAAPTPPPTGKAAVYARNRAGAPWIDVMRPSGRDFPLQPHFGVNRIANWSPSVTTTITTEGLPITSVGTVSHPTLAATNLAASMRRWRLTSAAVVDSAAEQRSAGWACWRGNAVGLGGWTFVTRISLTTLQATGMAFFGLYGSTAALATTLTLATAINCIGIGFQRGTHTRWQLVWNDGTGAPTMTDMGASFAIATGGVLTLFIAAPPNGSSVWVRVVDEVSGAVFEQEITADLPANTQFLSPRLFMNNGATAAAVAYDCSGVYVETDY